MATVGTNQYGMQADVFTRGQPGDADRRGESMVLKHAEKLQQEKETTSMTQLNALLPNLGMPTKVVALSECGWDLERALALLRRFQTENIDKLAALQKKRKRLLEAAGSEPVAAPTAAEASSSGQSSASDSSDSGSDSGSDESDASGEHQRTKKKSKKSKEKDGRKRSKRKRKKDKDKDKGRKRKKARREEKERERAREKARPATMAESFGKYGLIRETDFAAKRAEFCLWATEVKKMDVEIMPRFEERDLFKEYMEDFNTGTLPHRKYYDIDAYERQRIIRAARKGAKKADKVKPKVDDEEALRREREAERERERDERLRQAYNELRVSNKAQDMRAQELLRMQMTLAYKTGDMAKAQKLMERLKPDDPKEDKAAPRIVDQPPPT